jgi:hypothetical protein
MEVWGGLYLRWDVGKSRGSICYPATLGTLNQGSPQCEMRYKITAQKEIAKPW